MAYLLLVLLAWLAGYSGAADAQAYSASGQLRGLWSLSAQNPLSPAYLAQHVLQGQGQGPGPGLMAAPANRALLEAELHASAKGLSASATLQGQADGSGNTHASAWINELYGSLDAGAWQLSAGKKIVGWDVGYGFRPNDVVQQEQRRSFVSTTAIGRPLAMAEYFDATLAAALVWVNPAQGRASSSAQDSTADEQALAARVYYRAGAADLHGFARYGAQNGTSLGAAVAWVATEALEIHASGRYLRHNPGLVMGAASALLQRSSPWQPQMQANLTQALLGASWTTEGQHSLLLEAWWDGTAPSGKQWQEWGRRNRALAASIPVLPQFQHELAYNIAWQSQLLSGAANLRRQNVFARWSWQRGAWQPALDLLWTPEDGGRIVTATLVWQGDQVKLDAGIRAYAGSSASVIRQLPVAKMAYVAATWSF